eukprot:359740-Chlamydomonas_euryale.AAC.15
MTGKAGEHRDDGKVGTHLLTRGGAALRGHGVCSAQWSVCRQSDMHTNIFSHASIRLSAHQQASMHTSAHARTPARTCAPTHARTYGHPLTRPHMPAHSHMHTHKHAATGATTPPTSMHLSISVTNISSSACPIWKLSVSFHTACKV